MRRTTLCCAGLLSVGMGVAMGLGTGVAQQDSPVLGYWREPTGSVIHIEPCGDKVCATLVLLSKAAPANIDGHNPDESLRTRPLCGLRIGEGFHVEGAKAEGGTFYDPKSGKTYKGIMTAEGDELKLRGYIGMPAFGRTETWSRAPEIANPCVSGLLTRNAGVVRISR